VGIARSGEDFRGRLRVNEWEEVLLWDVRMGKWLE
jgi:hypothetical protein